MKHRALQHALLKRASDRIAIQLAQAEEQGDAAIQEAAEWIDKPKVGTRQAKLEIAVKGLVWDARMKGLRDALEIFRGVLKEEQRKHR